MKEYKYYAFISYKREDEEWAKWLQNKLEYFKLPININSGKDEFIRPVFRDITDLRPGSLPERIREALDESKFLIAVCSPRYSKSPWCDAEVRHFKETGRIRNVIPFIIDGKPYSEYEECFPLSLVELRGTENELLGADIRTLSSEYALVQVVATMFGVDVDSIWGRYLKDEEERKIKLKEQNDFLMSLQSRIVAGKAKELITQWPYDEKTAGKLMLEVLPSNFENPERPWVEDAEFLLRKVLHPYNLLQEIRLPDDTFPIAYCQQYICAVQPHAKTTMNRETNKLNIEEITPDYSIGIFNHEGENINFMYGLSYQHYGIVYKASFSQDNKFLAFLSRGKLLVLNVESQEVNQIFANTIHSVPERNTLKWSNDNRYLTCNNDNLIKIYDFKNKNEITIDGHSQNIISLSFNNTSNYLVSVGFDQVVKIWDVDKECQEIFTFNCPFFTSFASYDHIKMELLIVMDSSAGSHLANNDVNKKGRNIIRMINVETNEFKETILYDNPSHIKNAVVLKEYNIIFVASTHGIRVYDLNTGIKIDEYSGHKLNLDIFSKILSFVTLNKIEKYEFPFREQLLEKAKQELGSINLSDDIKYKYFIK